MVSLALTACGGGSGGGSPGDGGSSTSVEATSAGTGVGPSRGTVDTAEAAPVIHRYLVRLKAPKAALIECPPTPARKYELIACKVTLEDGRKAFVAVRVLKLGKSGPELAAAGIVPAEKPQQKTE